MKPATLTALKESIAHWDRLISGVADEKPVAEQCALCRKFYFAQDDEDTKCDGCPVYERTGHNGCWGTPFNSAANAFRNEDEDFVERATVERDFLVSLLPKEGVEA